MSSSDSSLVAVASRSFSQHPVLTRELGEKYPNLRLNTAGKSLSGEELVRHLQGAERAIIALERVDSVLLDQLPELKVIAKYGVGIDNLDLDALRAHGVRLGWTGGVNRRAVAELALTLMISSLRLTVQSHDLVRTGGWAQLRGRQLTGKTVGIIGLGHVGRDLVSLLKPFGCRVLGNDIRDVGKFAAGNGVELVEKETLFAESDIVTLHVPKTSLTTHLVDDKVLGSMKPGAVLINTARGGLVEEGALTRALADGPLAAAACDVFEVEPPADNPLLKLENFLPTSHIGGSSEEAVLAMGRAAISALDNSVEAVPENFS